MGADWPPGSCHTEIGGEHAIASSTSPLLRDPTHDFSGRLADSLGDFAGHPRPYVMFRLRFPPKAQAQTFCRMLGAIHLMWHRG